MSVDAFLAAYPPQTPRAPYVPPEADEPSLALGPHLTALLERAGAGLHADGMLQLVDPRAYLDDYLAFFGGDAGGRVPFMLNGFGEVIAYKRIGVRQDEISILHTYGPKLAVLAHDLGDFFDCVLLTDDGLRDVINVPLYRQVRSARRRLRPGEVYGFDPNLLAEEGEGAKADARYFEVVDAREHLSLLLRRAEG